MRDHQDEQGRHTYQGEPAGRDLGVPGPRYAGMPGSPGARPLWDTRPIADELFRAATDAYTGATRINRYLVSIGCAGALLAELVLATRAEPGQPSRPVLRTLTRAGAVILLPDHRLYQQDPPRDPLLYKVLADIVEDARDQRRPVTEFIEYLAEAAYQLVGERLATARMMVESERRTGLRVRRRRVWRAVEPPASLNALTRLPRMLRDREALPESDRVLLGLFTAIGLAGAARREFVDDFPLPDYNSLRLNEHLRAVVDATRAVHDAATRSH